MVISGKFLGHIMSYFHHISPQFFPVHPPIPTFKRPAELGPVVAGSHSGPAAQRQSQQALRRLYRGMASDGMKMTGTMGKP